MGNYYCTKCNVPIKQHHDPSRKSCRGSYLLEKEEGKMEYHNWKYKCCYFWITKY